MKKFLKRLLAGKRLIDYAQSDKPEEFVDELLRVQLHLVGLADQPGLDPDAVTEDTLLAYIEEHSKFEDEDFSPMTLDHEGGEAVLVFSTEEHRETFTAMFTRQADRVFAFQTATIDGDGLPAIAAQVSAMMLNPGSSESHTLTPEQFRLLQSRHGANKAE